MLDAAPAREVPDELPAPPPPRRGHHRGAQPASPDRAAVNRKLAELAATATK